MAPKGIVVARNIMIASPGDDIEEKVKPYLKMEQNLLNAPRSLLSQTPARFIPRLISSSPAARAIGFKAIPYAQIGLYKSGDRASWPVVHPVTTRTWALNKVAGMTPHSMPPAQVSRVARAPQIDGAIAANEYSSTPLLLAETPDRDKLKTAPGRAWLNHDGQRLYVAVSIPLSRPDKIVANASWGAADALELVVRLDTSPPGPTFVLHGFPDGRNVASLDAGASQSAARALIDSTSYAAKIGSDEWTGEWSVPLKGLGTAARPGLSLGFNVAARRLETDDWLVWTGTEHENWRLDGAGHIILK
jgi:hypothetical protein